MYTKVFENALKSEPEEAKEAQNDSGELNDGIITDNEGESIESISSSDSDSNSTNTSFNDQNNSSDDECSIDFNDREESSNVGLIQNE